MILFLHNRYRTIGGEERVVEELMSLVRDELGEHAELLERDSAALARGRAAMGLLGGGLDAGAVAEAVSRHGARVVHAHNLQPAFGARALSRARAAGARIVLHLHQYRLVCAVGVCYTGGRPCTRCHGRNTLPGVRMRCRGGVGEAVAYGAGLSMWQRAIARQADVVLVPSRFAVGRLRELGAPLDWQRVRVLAPPLRRFAEASGAAAGSYALVCSRLASEKGVDIAIEACRIAGVPLVVAGEGPARRELELAAAQGRPPGAAVRFAGRLAAGELDQLRRGAALALVPSRSENFSTAAAEAMAAGVPVVASRVGGLPELVEDDGLVGAEDPAALAEAIARRWGDEAAGERGLRQVRAICSPSAVAPDLASAYEAAVAA